MASNAITDSDVLVVRNLTKIYGRELQIGARKVGRRIVAVNDVSFSVKKGEIFGFLGPNGAGKTTAIRSILGYLTIKAGTIKINGLDHRKDGLEIKKNSGHIPGDVTLYGNFTGKELINYVGSFRPTDTTFLKKLRKIFKVDLSMKIRSLSSGNRQQVAIIVGLASNPDFLILDEPSSGLDPLMSARFHDLLREMRDQGKTIFLSSHDLAEVQAICDRVGIIRQGQIIVVEAVKELRRKSIQHLTVEFMKGEAPDVDAFKAIPNVIGVEKRDGTFHITVKEDVNDLLKLVTSQRIKRMTLEDSSLEDIFIEYYKDEIDRLMEE
ncbi:MAG: ABC transporter ATP-binding protein [Candidatus Heimdallarchaeota archaeon]|nr:MAG: ABC transporter ATP-binding protein [Candidatus Heimdallarchaeota archaeon]